MTHSSVDEAELACQIAREAPVFSEADLEALVELVDDASSRLRRVFVVGQSVEMPKDWRMDGILYKTHADALDKARAKLILRYQATKFFAGQRRRDGTKTTKIWLDAGGEEAARYARQHGTEVKMTTKNGRASYQYAVVHDGQ